MASTDTQTARLPTVAPPAQLPAIDKPIVVYKEADPQAKARIDKALAELNVKDSNSIIFFGARAQEQLTTISENMLEGVRNKDTGQAGSALSEMLSRLRGFKVDDLAPENKPSFFGRILGFGHPIARFVQQYEEVRKQIDGISSRLDTHKDKLIDDIGKLDELYVANRRALSRTLRESCCDLRKHAFAWCLTVLDIRPVITMVVHGSSAALGVARKTRAVSLRNFESRDSFFIC